MLEVLWLFCLSVLGQPLTVQPKLLCKEESVRTVTNIKMELSKVSKEVNFTLYTPPTNDTSCRNAFLLCFTEEVKVLSVELGLGGTLQESQMTWTLVQSLLRLTKDTVPEASCELRSCELHPEMSADSFLQNLAEILKQMNSSYCRKR